MAAQANQAREANPVADAEDSANEFQSFWNDISPAVQTISNAVFRRTGHFSLRFGITSISLIVVAVPIAVWHLLWEERASHEESYWGGEIELKTLFDLCILFGFVPLSIFYESKYGSFRHAVSLTAILALLWTLDVACFSFYKPYISQAPHLASRDVKDRDAYWHYPPLIAFVTPIVTVFTTRESIFPGFVFEKIRRARVLDQILGPVLPNVLFFSMPWIMFLLEWIAAPKIQLVVKMVLAILVGYGFYFAGPFLYQVLPASIVQ
ncbi:hypothetical protein HDU98_000801 [Podochytrium sp. JEL0797]|nr:hypothetical protein HDU98_000801 [Podochytrium sp. JEL0797]